MISRNKKQVHMQRYAALLAASAIVSSSAAASHKQLRSTLKDQNPRWELGGGYQTQRYVSGPGYTGELGWLGE